jgi:hypothetical protein
MFAGKAQKVLTKPWSYSNNIVVVRIRGGHDGNSLLHEVQEKERDKQSTASYAQESQTSHPRCLPCVRHKGIQNRETLNSYGGHLVSKGLTPGVIRGVGV